ncbi:MAG: cutinase family protein [Nocardia sp.]|nr:cutinase family protein [Nocardia sp.]
MRHRRVAVTVACTVLTAASVAMYSGTASGSPGTAPERGAGCSAVYMIVARGTTEPPGEGATASLVRRIKRATRQPIEDVAVDYPAVAQAPGDTHSSVGAYAASSSRGAAAVRNMLTAEAGRCPHQKIVMLGYSQGAQVIGDAVAGGGGGVLGPQTAPVPAAVTEHVVAMIQMGDPRHMVGQPFDVGSSRRDGMFPRTANQQLTPFSSRIRSYCDTGDTFCDRGRVFPVHLTYLIHYSDDATRFVVGAIGG